MFKFYGKICFISGVASKKGIGFAIAQKMGKQGATLVLADVSDKVFERAKEMNDIGINSEGYVCDLTDANAVNSIFEEIYNKYGKIDILINNAGWHEEGKTEDYPDFADAEYDDWMLKFKRNLFTTYNVTRRVLSSMRKNGYGRIVNISSVIGTVLGAEGDSAYAAGKGGIVGMSKSIAVEVAKNNVTINSVLPGYISSGSQEADAYEAGLKTPAKRNGEPEDVAYAVVFLASEEAGYITGQTLVIDGGSSVEMKFE